MAEAVIVAAARSPIGKRDGALPGGHSANLSAQLHRPVFIPHSPTTLSGAA